MPQLVFGTNILEYKTDAIFKKAPFGITLAMLGSGPFIEQLMRILRFKETSSKMSNKKEMTKHKLVYTK